MKLKHLMHYRAELEAPQEIGDGPHGARLIYKVTGGSFEGPRLRGKLLPTGADWMLVRPDGMSELDVRTTFSTDDGALLYLSYFGLLEMSDKVLEANAGARTMEFGEVYFMTQPRFETGDPRYSWLNKAVLVAEGRVCKNAVEYTVYQCTNGE